MKRPAIAIAVATGLVLMGLLLFVPSGVRAHELETSVDWDVAYANVRVVSPPLFTHTTTLPIPGGTPGTPGLIRSDGTYPTIAMATGDYLVVRWTFQYVGTTVVRGDIWWITRLGLDFGTLGRYINGNWIGSSSFELVPSTNYDATLVLRSLQPNLRHLHVGLSVQNVGNIPAAPTVDPIPAGGPTLYGVFTDANGPVVEPLQGVSIGGSPFVGTFILLGNWPWAVAGFVGQVALGLVFIGVMYWYARWERKRGAAT